MQAIMLAAGIGARLSNNDSAYLPKCLLRFDEQSLLARHIDILRDNGIDKLTLVVGYRADDIHVEINKIGAGDFVKTVLNNQFRNGSIVSLNCARETMCSGEDILFMDADVLYHPELIRKLTTSPTGDYILYDPDFEPGDEPVTLCLNEDKIVEFKKDVNVNCDTVGEWPGFVKWSSKSAMQIAEIISRKIKEGAIDLPYEDGFREFLLSSHGDNVISENISGLPWIEIDFPEDLERARKVILPAIKA